MLSRTDLEAREDSQLAPYAMRSMNTRGRKYAEEEHPYRTVYQRDRDRIIHCNAFRRLEYKTQVFVNYEGDYYRTRLTHTLEVAQIARSIARALNANEDLTEAIALAHDLGHTPFGHSGEDALKELMKDHGGFEHNMHGLRVVDLLEKRYPAFPGLNLSWEVRESIVKHSRSATSSQDVAGEFRMDEQPIIEAQIVEISDGIAYDAHDLDDSLKMGIIGEGDLKDIALWQMASERSRESANNDRIAELQTVLALINLEVTNVLEQACELIEEMGVNSPDCARLAARSVVSFSDDLREKKVSLEKFLFENVYRHYRVARMAHKAKRLVRQLFNAYVENPRQLPPEFQQWAEQEGTHRAVCDYIAGMTDRYAQDEYMKLFYPYERV